MSCNVTLFHGKGDFHAVVSWIVAISFLLVSGNLIASGQNYSIDWYKIAGGGGTSTGGPFSVSGTIGQHDAGPTAAAGGGYSLVGGFWALYTMPGAGGPLLKIMLTTTNTAVVYWPSPSTGWTLQAVVNPVNTNWATPPEPVQDNGTTKYIVIAPGGGSRVFRLKSP